MSPRHCLRFLTQKLLYFAPLAYHSLTYRGELIVTYVDNDPHGSKRSDAVEVLKGQDIGSIGA